MDTIAAIATPIGTGAIGIVRISGPAAIEVAARVFVPDPSDLPANTARHGKLIRPVSNYPRAEDGVIDDAVITVFRAPSSYTGEDVVEISCHGGLSTVKSVLEAVLDAGARLANPGEFTQRAFLNGKMDLVQAEAVNDIIRARTDVARRIALRQLEGDLSKRVSEIDERILGVVAAIEAAIDFPDDVSEPDPSWLEAEIRQARDEIEELLATFGRGRIYREGLRVVIAGRVNVGKSSLLNALLRHARAIVTPIPGTTRDLIEESLEIEGIPVVAIDTAGLRATDDPVESIGVELTRRSIESADVVLLVIDATEGLHDEDRALLVELADRPVVLVANKVDLVGVGEKDLPPIPSTVEGECACTLPAAGRVREGSLDAVRTSALTGQGIEELEAKIARIAGGTALRQAQDGCEGVLVSNVRHHQALKSASESLSHAMETLAQSQPIDLLSGDLAAARRALGLITGRTATEDLLDRIFSEFCIGK